MVKLICIDGKCIYARVSYFIENRPSYAASYYGEPKLQVSVYCMKKHRVIAKQITKCVDLQNSTLTAYTSRKR